MLALIGARKGAHGTKCRTLFSTRFFERTRLRGQIMGRNARDLCSMRVPSSRGTGRGATIALVGPNKFLSRGAIEVACDGCMQRGATAAEHVATFDSRGRGFVNWSRANADSTRRENRLGRYLVRDPFVRDSNLWSASRCRTPRITSLLLAREITAISFNGHLCPPLLPQRVILPSTVFSLRVWN